MSVSLFVSGVMPVIVGPAVLEDQMTVTLWPILAI